MADKITIDRIMLLHPSVRGEALVMYKEICTVLTGNAICRFTHTLRTYVEQSNLFEQGRSKPGKIVTWARAGYSYHNFGLAIDICLIIDGKVATWDTIKDFDKDGVADWMEVVKVFKKYGWEWGGDWKSKKDYPHFQKTFNYSTEALRNAKTEGNYPVISAGKF
jgi:peptidoglycan LD-endopeptidase CwlK